MADNTLKAVIDVSAPGAVQTFKDVGNATETVNNTLKQLGQQGVLNVKSISDALKQLKSVLSVTTNPADISKLNTAITGLESKLHDFGGVQEHLVTGSQRAGSSILQLSRAFDILPGETAHVAHSFDQLFVVFERLQEHTGSTGEALKAFGGLLAGPVGIGLAISVGVTLLSELTKGLFENKDALELSKNALARYAEEVDNVKASVKNLNDELTFSNQIGALDLKIRGVGDITNLREQSVAQRQFTADIQKQQQDLADEEKRINNDQTLNEKDRTEALKKNRDEQKELEEKYVESVRRQEVLYREIKVQSIKDDKEAHDKALKEYQDYLKRLQEERDFEDRMLAGIAKTFKELQKFELANVINPEIKLRGNIFKDIQLDPTGTDFADEPVKKISKNLQQAARDAFKNFFLHIPVKPVVDADLKELDKQMQDLNAVFSAGFDNIFNSIGEGIASKNIGQGLFNAIGSLIEGIGKALIKYGIIKTGLDKILAAGFKIPGAFAIALGIAAVAIGNLLKATKIQGFASGGPVQGGVPILVGERGAEIFVPNTGGRIVSNSQARASFAGVGGGMNVNIRGEFVQRGLDMVAVITKVEQYLSRNK